MRMDEYFECAPFDFLHLKGIDEVARGQDERTRRKNFCFPEMGKGQINLDKGCHDPSGLKERGDALPDTWDPDVQSGPLIQHGNQHSEFGTGS